MKEAYTSPNAKERERLLAAKRMLEADGNAFAGCSCIREVLLRGQTELDRVDRLLKLGAVINPGKLRQTRASQDNVPLHENIIFS